MTQELAKSAGILTSLAPKIGGVPRSDLQALTDYAARPPRPQDAVLMSAAQADTAIARMSAVIARAKPFYDMTPASKERLERALEGARAKFVTQVDTIFRAFLGKDKFPLLTQRQPGAYYQSIVELSESLDRFLQRCHERLTHESRISEECRDAMSHGTREVSFSLRLKLLRSENSPSRGLCAGLHLAEKQLCFLRDQAKELAQLNIEETAAAAKDRIKNIAAKFSNCDYGWSDALRAAGSDSRLLDDCVALSACVYRIAQSQHPRREEFLRGVFQEMGGILTMPDFAVKGSYAIAALRQTRSYLSSLLLDRD